MDQTMLRALIAIKAQADAISASAEALLADLDEEYGCRECRHPQDKREDCSTMGNPKFRCRDCGKIIKGDSNAGAEE